MLKVVKRDPKAVIPSSAHPEDIGLDLTCINVKKKLENGVIIYDTGISVQPPEGYYIEIIPRSSLSKTGWFLANSVGIIDPNYTGTLGIPLAPLSIVSKELTVPFCKFQLVVRKAYKFSVLEVDNIDNTERGDGGFGSTGDRV
tara:strand:+ start:2549 stop:2977 length:429 start_codon:yes stop_codon:yes gene_type:complete